MTICNHISRLTTSGTGGPATLNQAGQLNIPDYSLPNFVTLAGGQAVAIPNATDSTDAVVKLNQLIAALRTYGLIAP